MPDIVVAALTTVEDLARAQLTRAARQIHDEERNTMSDISLPEAVRKFVETTNAHDGDALFDVFAPGATVVDDGTTYDTEAALREWITVHQVNPRIVITPISFTENRLVGSADGEFPGSPLMFAFTFTAQDDVITGLSIEPA